MKKIINYKTFITESKDEINRQSILNCIMSQVEDKSDIIQSIYEDIDDVTVRYEDDIKFEINIYLGVWIYGENKEEDKRDNYESFETDDWSFMEICVIHDKKIQYSLGQYDNKELNNISNELGNMCYYIEFISNNKDIVNICNNLLSKIKNKYFIEILSKPKLESKICYTIITIENR